MAINEANSDPDCRVIVFTGKGRAFCAGADAQGRFDPATETPEERTRRHAVAESKKTWNIRRIEEMCFSSDKPIIAAVNGGCVGVGLSLALGADLIFAANEAKVGVIFPQRGLIAEEGMAWQLPNRMGTANALMMLVTGEVMRAEEWPAGLFQALFPVRHQPRLPLLVRCGVSAPLAQQLTPTFVVQAEELMAGTLEWATALSVNSSPTAVSVIKQQIYTQPTMTWKDNQRINDIIQSASTDPTPGANPDHEEGFDAFLSKREPNFEPLNKELQFYKNAREQLGSLLPTRL